MRQQDLGHYARILSSKESATFIRVQLKGRIVCTLHMQDPPYDAGSFAKIVTRDASEEGGSAPACSSNVRQVGNLVHFQTSMYALFGAEW